MGRIIKKPTKDKDALPNRDNNLTSLNLKLESSFWKPVVIDSGLDTVERKSYGLFVVEELCNDDFPITASERRPLSGGESKQKKSRVDKSSDDTLQGSTCRNFENDDLMIDVEENGDSIKSSDMITAFEEDYSVLDSALRNKMKEWLQILPECPPSIVTALAEAGFIHPTPVQREVLPTAIIARKDIVAAAETGSGKTLAFGIPIVVNILHALRVRLMKGGPVERVLEALIILPSRELATQVHTHIQRITKGTPVNTCCVIGGISAQKQIRILDLIKPQIVIATPGRLCALMGGFKENHLETVQLSSSFLSDFTRVRYFALDEDDRLTETGHFSELSVILKHLYAQVDQESRVQSFIFSATMALPKSSSDSTRTDPLDHLNLGHLTDAMKTLLGKIRLRTRTLVVIDLTTPLESNHDDHLLLEKQNNNKLDLKLPASLSVSLLRCLEKDRVLVFVNSISYVYRLEPLLSLLFNDHPMIRTTNRSKRRYPNSSHVTKKPSTLLPNQRPPSGAATSFESHGVALLSQFLSQKSTSTQDDPSSEDADSMALDSTPYKSRRYSIKTHTQEASVHVFGIHSKLKQSQRLKRMERFQRPGIHGVLVCTDVAARGLDLPAVDVVIHCQAPRSAALFVHRSGRTARANRKGSCVGLCTPTEMKEWHHIFSIIGRQIDSVPDPELLYNLTSKQIIALRERFLLAGVVERFHHQSTKAAKEDAWVRRAAAEADVVCDTLVDVSDNEEDYTTNKAGQKHEADRNKLKDLLEIPVWKD